MNILLIGGLNVNPERFLPVLDRHNVVGIWESRAQWSHVFRAGGPYVEIPTISIEEIPERDIDIVWCLLSPWDGTKTLLEIKRLYPYIPVVRQCQGGATPAWNTITGGKRRLREHRRRTRPCYEFGPFARSLELCDGLMFNAAKYRECLISQGAKIEHTPFLLSNGMAYNADILGPDVPKLYEKDHKPHVSLIGRNLLSVEVMNALRAADIPVHVHAKKGRKPKDSMVVHEPYYGDVRMIRKMKHVRKTVRLKRLLAFKQATWSEAFGRYDAGLMHIFSEKGIDVYNGVDINVPGRVNTYMLAGLPPIVNARDSGILDFLESYGDRYYIAYTDEKDLVAQLLDRKHLTAQQKKSMELRYLFSMQEELPKIERFFLEVIDGRTSAP